MIESLYDKVKDNEYTFIVICNSTKSTLEVEVKLGEFVAYMNKPPFGRDLPMFSYQMLERLPTKGIYTLYGKNHRSSKWLDEKHIYGEDRELFQEDYTVIINKDIYPLNEDLKMKSLIRECKLKELLK